MNVIDLFTQGSSGAVVEYLEHNLKVEGSRMPVLKCFAFTPPENSGGTENSAENSGAHARIFFAICTN
jgi:hypothetical protein